MKIKTQPKNTMKLQKPQGKPLPSPPVVIELPENEKIVSENKERNYISFTKDFLLGVTVLVSLAVIVKALILLWVLTSSGNDQVVLWTSGQDSGLGGSVKSPDVESRSREFKPIRKQMGDFMEAVVMERQSENDQRSGKSYDTKMEAAYKDEDVELMEYDDPDYIPDYDYTERDLQDLLDDEALEQEFEDYPLDDLNQDLIADYESRDYEIQQTDADDLTYVPEYDMDYSTDLHNPDYVADYSNFEYEDDDYYEYDLDLEGEIPSDLLKNGNKESARGLVRISKSQDRERRSLDFIVPDEDHKALEEISTQFWDKFHSDVLSTRRRIPALESGIFIPGEHDDLAYDYAAKVDEDFVPDYTSYDYQEDEYPTDQANDHEFSWEQVTHTEDLGSESGDPDYVPDYDNEERAHQDILDNQALVWKFKKGFFGILDHDLETEPVTEDRDLIWTESHDSDWVPYDESEEHDQEDLVKEIVEYYHNTLVNSQSEPDLAMESKDLELNLQIREELDDSNDVQDSQSGIQHHLTRLESVLQMESKTESDQQ